MYHGISLVNLQLAVLSVLMSSCQFLQLKRYANDDYLITNTENKN